MSKSLIYCLVFVFIFTSCSKSPELKKDHLNFITLKLEKNLDLALEQKFISNSDLQMIAKVKYTNTIQSLIAKWSLVDLNDNIIYQSQKVSYPNSSSFSFESENFKISNQSIDYKVVLEITAQSENEQIVKSQIFYTKSQSEIDDALKDLQERSEKF